MLLAALVAVLALAVVVLAARPGDGRTETAVALPLAAVLAARSPPVALALLGGALAATLALGVLESRTLLYGRWLRAAAAAAGATVPLATVALGGVLGAVPPYPELWIAGSVVPGTVVYEHRRRGPAGLDGVALLGLGALAAVAVGGVLARLVWLGEPAGWWWIGSATVPGTGAAAGTVPTPLLAALLLAGLFAGVLARWRYGLHVGPLSVPLLAAWSVVWPVALAAYVLAGAATRATLPVLAARFTGQRLSAVGGVVGVGAALATLWIVGAAPAGAAGTVAVVAAVLAAEDARLLRTHAGVDHRDALLLGGTLYVWLLLGAIHAAGEAVGPLYRPLVGTAGLAALVALVAIALRERARPSERRLRAQERRWTP